MKCELCNKQHGEKWFTSYEEYKKSTEPCECGGKLIRDWMGKGGAALWQCDVGTASNGKGVK